MDDPLVKILYMFQSKANEANKEIKLPWSSINKALAQFGAPSIDYNSFSKQYDSDQNGALQHILNGDTDSFSENGIVLTPDNAPREVKVVDKEHSKVKQTAMHALKTKKR